MANNTKSKTFLIGLVGGVGAVALIGGCELIASVNHDDIKDSSSAASTTGSGGGSSSSSASTSGSTTSSVSSSASSSDASSSSGGCTDPSQCMQPTAECEEATCNGMMCGVGDKTATTPCTEGGGKVCDGMGNCVACLADGDCASTPATPKCDMAGHICVAATCADMTKNGNETDVDCGGGAPCSACPVTKVCAVASDCLSGFCQAGAPNKCAACASDSNCANSEYCDTTTNGGTCTPKVVDGDNCTANNQCVNAHCVGTGLKICCNTACDTTCLTCFAAEKASGMGEGTCGPAAVNTDPRNECPTSGSNDCQKSTCDGTTAAGKCGQQPASATCGQSDACTTDATSSKFVVQQFCSGASDTCAAPATPQNCPSNYGCQDATSCATMCTFNNTAAPNGTSTGCAPLFYCDDPSATCVNKKSAGGACTQNYECLSNNCDNPGTNMCQ